MRSFQKGAWDNVIESSVSLFYGHIQIQEKDFPEEESLDNSFIYNDEIAQKLENNNLVEHFLPRINSFALASADDITQGVLILGIDPQKEDAMTHVSEKVVDGNYFNGNKNEILIASGVAKKLSLSVQDTIVLISQGYHGSNAAGKYPIVGIFEYPLPDLNKSLVYLPLETAQSFFAAENRVTSIALKLENAKKVPAAMSALNKGFLSDSYAVRDYEDLMPELMQARQLDEGGGYFTLGILYALIAFAIFGTIIMMTEERTYEYGVLNAIGMGRWQLFAVSLLETIMVGIAGSILGILLAMPIVYYLNINPLDLSAMGEEATAAFEKFGMVPQIPTAFESSIFFNQAIVIFIITLLLGLYPMYKIFRLQPVKAMRS